MNDIPAKQCVLGLGVSVTSYSQVLRQCRRWIEERRAWRPGAAPAAPLPPGRSIFALNVHSVMTGVLCADIREVLNSADIATPDGMPLAWALRSFGAKGQARVYGPDMMLALCGQATREGHRVFLFGGSPETLPQLSHRLSIRFPKLTIAGAISPPFRPITAQEDVEYVRRITEAEADIVFVGIGAPKQERWIMEHRSSLPGVVMLGVGAAFNFHAGTVSQAPAWMQRNGLEWLFRLWMEPARLWSRYLLLNPLFLVMWALQWAGLLPLALRQRRS
jgi:N-acetylglucosaminyldiphosphoundecaprenol N-acetyl-beta-D-mannosaminyltransferase